MKAAIISGGSKSSTMTADAMRKYFEKVDELNIKEMEINFSGKKSEVLYQGKPIEDYDCVFAKGSFRFGPLLRSISSLLSPTTYMPYISSAYSIAHDKLLTQLTLQQKNIPMPRTYLSSTTDAAKEILERMNYPVIMKFPQGTQGKGVMFADSFASASSMLDALDALNQPFIIQEYVETGGIDIRAFVVGDTVVAAMKRKAKPSEVRANLNVGGISESVELDAHTKRISIDAARAIGAEICGVDILESAKGPLVLEVNISPGLQGITEATKIDVADKIAKYLYKRTLEEKEQTKDSGTAKIMKELETGKEKEIITNLDFRGTRVLLPEVIIKSSKITEADNVQITSEAGKIIIKKLNIS